MSSSLIDLRIILPAVGAIGIAIIGYLISTGSLQTADTMTLAHNSCEVSIKGTPAHPIEPISACNCIFTEIYPRLTQDTRNYFTDLYVRVEANAPNSKYARAQYDSNFSERLAAIVAVDQAADPFRGMRIAREIDAIGKTPGLSPNCQQLTSK